MPAAATVAMARANRGKRTCLYQVTQVDGRRSTSRFVDAAWRVHEAEGSKGWIPPLRAVVKDGLDQRGNPFYEQADRALFIVQRDGVTVGRIAAIENRSHNRHHGDRVGFFGFFECRNDGEAADALFARELARRSKEIGAEGAEASWILEDNEPLIRPLEGIGMRPYKRWRIYEKRLGASA